MMASANRALLRAPMLTAAAVGVLVLGGLTAGGLTREAARAEGLERTRVVASAHANAAPPQSLAFTAEFFAIMGMDERAEAEEAPEAVAPAAPCSLPLADRKAIQPETKATELAATRGVEGPVPDSATLTLSAARDTAVPLPSAAPGLTMPSRSE